MALEVGQEFLIRGTIARRAEGKFEPRDYCVQYRESDFAFASRLMEEEGIFYFFDHSGDEEKLVLADGKGAISDITGIP